MHLKETTVTHEHSLTRTPFVHSFRSFIRISSATALGALRHTEEGVDIRRGGTTTPREWTVGLEFANSTPRGLRRTGKKDGQSWVAANLKVVLQ